MRELRADVPVVSAPAPLAPAMVVLITAVVGCSLYANLSVLVTNPAGYRFFPPFERGRNQNHNDHVGAEYYHIAGALVSGRGFADPFQEPTGPTAWMAPVLSLLLAALRWAAGDDKEVVIAVFVLFQDLTLIGTGLLLLALARRTTGRIGLATVIFVVALLYYFRLSFQFTHDCWIILATLDLVIAGLVWVQPLGSSRGVATAWGIFGGLCALTSPVVGFVWGILTLAGGWRPGRRARLAFALLAAGLTVTPWVVRNYLVFCRFIPVKSNLAFELYQAQCVPPDGVLRDSSFATHPYCNSNEERQLYKQLGEMAYLDQKWERFSEAIRHNPLDFAGRVANRFRAATLVYTPFSPADENRRPWTLRLNRLIYPLPFLCLLLVLATTPWRPLAPAHGIVMGVYLGYLLPYVVVSYYERYKFPLIGTEAALVVWGIDRVWCILRYWKWD
jgi:hypothetical protein